MNTNKINRLAMAFGLFGILALVGTGVLFWQRCPLGPAAASPISHDREKPEPAAGLAEEHEEEAGHGHEQPVDEHDGHGHRAEGSDLDKPIAELWAARCEHDIPAHQCEECRYETGVVKLAPSLFDSAGQPGLVRVARVETRPFGASLTVNGEVGLNEAKTIHVSSPLFGTIKRMAVELGARVAAGDPLLVIDSHEVAEAKADFLKQDAEWHLAKKTAEREQLLFAKKISAASEVETALARETGARIALANARAKLLRLGVAVKEVDGLLESANPDLSGELPIRSPASGVVLAKQAVAGELLEPGKDVVLIANLAEVWVWTNLSERDLQAVQRAGGRIEAEVRTTVGDGRSYRGLLDLAGAGMDEKTRTLRGRIVLQNPHGELRPGMFVNVRLFLETGKAGLAIPMAAVLTDEGRSFVFVHQEGDYWIRRPVALGERAGDLVAVNSGLATNQKIIADGAFILKSDVLRSKMGAGCAD